MDPLCWCRWIGSENLNLVQLQRWHIFLSPLTGNENATSPDKTLQLGHIITTTTTTTTTQRQLLLALRGPLQKMDLLQSLRRGQDAGLPLNNNENNHNHNHKSHRPPAADSPVRLDIVLETPAVVLVGPETESPGFIVTGLVKVVPVWPDINRIHVSKLQLSLVQHVKYCKPFIFNDAIISPCPGCNTKTNTIINFKVLQHEPVPFDQAEKRLGIPMSFLVPGDTLASSVLGISLDTTILYEITVEMNYCLQDESNDNYRHLVTRMPIIITRAIPKQQDMIYLRRFEPTRIEATIVLPHVIHPKSTLPVEIVFKNVRFKNRRWRIKRILWRLTERAVATEDPCKTHKPLLDELKERLSTAKHRLVLQTDKFATLEVRKVATPDPTADLYAHNTDNLIYAANIIDDEILNRHDDHRYHPLDPENPRNRPPKPIRPQRKKLKYLDALTFSEERELLGGEFKKGWKVDYNSAGTANNSNFGGLIHFISNIDLKPLRTPGIHSYLSVVLNDTSRTAFELQASDMRKVNCCCDIAMNESGEKGVPRISVQHFVYFDVEMAEEDFCQDTVQKLGLSTGLVKMLRTKFPVILTERNGLVVAWDEEAPPKYSWEPPPAYYD